MKHSEFNADDRIDVKVLEHSIHFLNGEIDEISVGECIRWLTYENLDPKPRTLTLYVNSPGGDLYQAFALIDMMRNSKHPIQTVGIGLVMSAGFLIFAAGTKGMRYAAKNTSFMCHQFSESSEGKYHDVKAAIKESERLNSRMLDILKESTGQTAAVVKKKLLPPSDVYLSAQETIDIGAADHLL